MSVDEYILTGFSVFLGAAAAFILEYIHSGKKQLNKQYKAGIFAQFLLSSQINSLTSYRNQSLLPLKEDPDRAHNLFPVVNAYPEMIDFSSINFLLEDKFRIIRNGKFINLLHELEIAQKRYLTMIGGIKQRNEIHLHYQDALSKRQAYKMSRGEALNDDDLVIPPYSGQLGDLTDNIYQYIDEYIDDLSSQRTELGEAIRYGLVKRPLEYGSISDG